jgi:hypothetical protein
MKETSTNQTRLVYGMKDMASILGRKTSLHAKLIPAQKTSQAFTQWVQGPWIGEKSAHSSLFTAEDKYVWRSTSTYLYIFSAWCSTEYKGNFISS